MNTSREYTPITNRMEYISKILKNNDHVSFETEICCSEKKNSPLLENLPSHEICRIYKDFINHVERMSPKEFMKLSALLEIYQPDTFIEIFDIYVEMGYYIFIRDVCDSDDLSAYFYEMFPLLCPKAMETCDFKEIIRNNTVAQHIEAEHEIMYHTYGCLIKVDSHNAFNPIIRILFDQ